MSGLVEVFSVLVSFLVAAVVIAAQLKNVKPKDETDEAHENVKPIDELRNRRLLKNIEDFIKAEDMLTANNHDEYMRLYSRALNEARKNLEVKEKRKAG